MLTYRSNGVVLARILLSGFLLILISGFFELYGSGGLSTLQSILIAGLTGGGILAIRLLYHSVIVTLSDETLSFRNGFRLLGTKPRTVSLKQIHTIHLSGAGNTGSMHPGHLILIYRWPARKMLHATMEIPVATIPDANQLIVEVARRTNATIKLYSGGMAVPQISLEELQASLGIQQRELPEKQEELTDNR